MAVSVLPDQRVPISKKLNEDWYMNNAHYHIDLAISVNDKADTQDHIDASNGLIPMDVYKDTLNPLSASEVSNKSLPGTIRNIDFITPIREKNVGEYIELPHNILAAVNDPDVAMLRNHAVAQQVRPVIEQAVVNKINEQMQTGVPTNDVGALEDVIDKAKQDWFDERAIQAKDLSDYIFDLNDYETFRLSAFNQWWATEQVYVDTRIQGDDIHFDLVDAMEGFPISNGNEYVDDHDAFVIRRRISINRILEYHADKLTEKDYKYLQSLVRDNKNGSYYVDTQLIESLYGRKEFKDHAKVGPTGSESIFSDSPDIYEYKIYFKTQVKHKILTRVNPLGQMTTLVVDKDYTLNQEIGDISAEIQWLDEVWTQVLLGEYYSGIYLKPEPIPVQIYDSKGHVKLPVTGKKGILNGIYINPIPKRIGPSQAMFNIVNLQIERQMSKYKGAVEIIPQSMLGDEDTGDPVGSMFYRLADNTIIYDDAEVDLQTVVQGYRIAGNDIVSNYIRTLIDFRNQIKDEAWDMANMNDARFGQAPASSTVTNNNQNIFRAKLGSVLMTTVFNQIMVRLASLNLELAKVAYADGIGGSFFNTKTNKVHYFNIDSHTLTNNQFNLFMTNAIVEQGKLDEYKNIAHAAAQNQEFGLASAAIDGESSAELRKHISKFIEDKQKFEQEMRMQEANAGKEVQAMINEENALEHDRKLELITHEEEQKKIREIAVEGVKNNK